MRASALRLLLALLPAAGSGAAVGAPQEMLECECDKVRCGCTKQCSCMQADENTGASFLQTVELAGEGAFLEVEALNCRSGMGGFATRVNVGPGGERVPRVCNGRPSASAAYS